MPATCNSPRARTFLERAGVLAFYLAVWALLAAWIDQPLLLPAPGEVLRKLLVLLPDPMLYRTLFYTLLRTLSAYLLGDRKSVV